MSVHLTVTWRWVVLFLFFLVSVVLGVVVLIHFRCGHSLTEVPGDGPDDDRDFNKWRDLDTETCAGP